MLGRGNWNSFTFRELKNNVKIMTMRGGGASGTVWMHLGREAAAVEIQQEETEVGEKRHRNCTFIFTGFSLSTQKSKCVCRKENEMWCKLRTDVCAGPLNPDRMRLYLSEVGQHIRTSFTHLGQEDDGCVENTCGTGRRATGQRCTFTLQSTVFLWVLAIECECLFSRWVCGEANEKGFSLGW